MDRGDAGKKAERLERAGRIGGGTAERTGAARQTVTASEEKAGDGAPGLMEEVLRRENLMAAYKRVVRNGSAGGVDGRSVDDLKEQIRAEWPRIREQLLAGMCEPSPVRKVEIDKPGGGICVLGIPTVMDRMIQQVLQQSLTQTPASGPFPLRTTPVMTPSLVDPGLSLVRNAGAATVAATSST